jgi:hypothetical protein
MSYDLPLRSFFENPAIPRLFKAIFLFGLPFVLLGGIAGAIWLVSILTNVLTAAYIGIVLLSLIITFAFGKIDQKTFLIALCILGWPFPPIAFAGVVWLIRSYW